MNLIKQISFTSEEDLFFRKYAVRVIRRVITPTFVLGYNPDPRSFSRSDPYIIDLYHYDTKQVTSLDKEEYSVFSLSEPFLNQYSFDEFAQLAIAKESKGGMERVELSYNH